MRLRSTGAGAMGVSTDVSVNGVVVATSAQYPRWYDDAGNVLLYISSGTLETIDLDTSTVTTIDTAGAVTLGAGNSLYVASLSVGALQGVRSNIVGWTRLPLAGLGDMDETGAFAVIQNFAGDNGISLYTAAGVLVTTVGIPIAPGAVIRCKNGLVAFSGSASAWQLRRLSTGAAVPFAQRVQGVIETVPVELADGRIFVVERTGNDTLTVRLATGNQGYVISSSIVFNPDVIELTPGVLRIGYSATAGEGPTALRLVDLTLGTGATSLGTTASGSLVFSAGPVIPVSSLPATLQEQGLLDAFLGRTQWTKPDHYLTEYAWQWLAKLAAKLGQPIDLASQTTGVLPGGSVDPDLSVLNASNVTIGTLPQNVKWQQYDTSAAGAQDNFVFSLGPTQADCIRCANASTLTLSGLVAGVPGQRLVVIASDADVVFLHESLSSTDVNRIETFSNLDVTVTVDQAAYFSYDGTSDRWRLLLVSAASSATSEGYWSPLCAGDTVDMATVVPATGYWSPLMTGPDAATSELVLDINGDTYALWTQLTPGPYFPPLVDSQADTISVWTPTP